MICCSTLSPECPVLLYSDILLYSVLEMTVALRQVGTLSIDLKEMCKKEATREMVNGEWYLRCLYLIGMGFGASGLSLFALRPGDTWNRTEVNY